MTVTLSVTDDLQAASPVSDSLDGGGTGVDLLNVTNGQYAPLVDQPSNDGARIIYLSHDAANNPITSLRWFGQNYGVGTGATYGGVRTAADDYTAIKALGSASGSSKNNGDGLSGGIWVEQDYDVSQANQFDNAVSSSVDVLGLANNGIDEPSAFQVKSISMVVNNAGSELAPTAPVNGNLGKSGDLALGDRSKLRFRVYTPTSFAEGGVYQFETVFAFSFTS